MSPVEHGYYAQLLSERLDGELSPEQERELEDHLAQCQPCRELAQQLAWMKDGWSELEELQAPREFAADVICALSRKSKILPLFRGVQKAAMTAVAAAVVLVVALNGPGVPAQAPAEDQSAAGEQQMLSAVPRAASLPEDGLPEDSLAADSAASNEIQAQPYGLAAGEEALQTDAAMLLVLERLPDGALELFPEEVTVLVACGTQDDRGSGCTIYQGLSREVLDQVAVLALEQQIGAQQIPGTGAREGCDIRVPS